MSPLNLFLIVLAGFCFAAWPPLAKACGANSAWLGFTVMMLTGLVVALLQPRSMLEVPPTQALGILILSGTINGVGMFAYGKLLSNPQVPVSTAIPGVLMCMLVTGLIAGVVFLHEGYTWRNVLGVVFAFPVIWLITSK